jgi:hypothetical protein
MLAALNHPNIAQIYGIEEPPAADGGVQFQGSGFRVRFPVPTSRFLPGSRLRFAT